MLVFSMIIHLWKLYDTVGVNDDEDDDVIDDIDHFLEEVLLLLLIFDVFFWN